MVDSNMEPPSYEEVTSSSSGQQSWATTNADSKSNLKTVQHITIQEEVGLSRAQHVAALVCKLLPQIRERAKGGLSKTTLLLMPSDQDVSRKGQLVGFPEEDEPILIQLEGRYDGTQFWAQDEALKLLREQLLVEIAGEIPPASTPALLPPRPEPVRTLFWSRKQGKAPQSTAKSSAKLAQLPVSVKAQLDYVNFRTETEFGLYETLRGRAVLVVVEVR